MAFDLKATIKLTDEFTRPMRRIVDLMDSVDRSMQDIDRTFDIVNRSVRTASSSVADFGRDTARSSDLVSDLQRDLNRATDEAQRLAGAGDGMSGSLGSAGNVGRGAGLKIAGALGGVITAIAGVVSGAKLMEEAIGAAARFESSEVLIEAMFNDDKASKEYIKMVDKMAKNSPVLNSDDMLANSKSFISLTKESELLGKAWGVVEKLNVLDPVQGIEGAVLAVRELAGGDVVSLAERFELPKKTLNDLKKLTFEEQVAGMEKLLAGMNITDDVIEKMGNTTMSKWNQVQETFGVALRGIGETANTEIGNALEKFNSFLEGGSLDKLVAIGDKVLGSAFSGMIDSVEGAMSAFDRFQNAPAVLWMQETLPGIFQTVQTAIQSALASESVIAAVEGISSWLTKVQETGRKLWDFMIEMGPGIMTVFQDLWIVLQPIFGALGTAFALIGDIIKVTFDSIIFPVLKLAWSAFQTLWDVASPLLMALGVAIQVTFGYLQWVWDKIVKPVVVYIGDAITNLHDTMQPVLSGISGFFEGVGDSISGALDQVNDFVAGLKSVEVPGWLSKGASVVGEFLAPNQLDGSHATGLARVPFDSYTAELHKDEAVLTADQSERLRSMGVLKSTAGKPVIDTSALSGQRTGTGHKVDRSILKKRATVSVGSIVINGANKTTKEMVREMVDELKYVISAGALEG